MSEETKPAPAVTEEKAPEVPAAEVSEAASADEIRAALAYYRNLMTDVIRDPKAYALDAPRAVMSSIYALEDMLPPEEEYLAEDGGSGDGGLQTAFNDVLETAGDVFKNIKVDAENKFKKWGLDTKG